MHKDYKHLVEIRAKDIDTNNNKMIVEGKAIVYDSETILFKDGDTEYKEIIKKGAFTEANLKALYQTDLRLVDVPALQRQICAITHL